MSTLAISTFPSCLATSFSNLGPRILQGPHHLMEQEKRGDIRRGRCSSSHGRRAGTPVPLPPLLFHSRASLEMPFLNDSLEKHFSHNRAVKGVKEALYQVSGFN